MIRQLLITALSVLLLTGCSKSRFTLEFDLPADVNGTFRSVCHASDKRGGTVLEQIAVVTDGKGSLNVPAVNPTVLFLHTSLPTPLAIYAERGQTIKISGSSPDPASWTVGGNETNELLSRWRAANAADLASARPEALNGAVARFVADNPDSPVAPLLLLTSFSRQHDETLFRRLWQGLPDNRAKQQWASLLSRADLPSVSLRTPGQLRSLALRSLRHGVDTIRPSRARATLIWFWHTGDNARRTTADSIRALSRQFPDSASRIIADVCLDPDTLAWRAPLIADSLRNTVRLWAPQGRAARQLMDLDVPRTPFFIVFSPDGNQVHRGSDPAEALSSFRTLMAAHGTEKKADKN